MDTEQALKDDAPQGPKEVKPVQFFGDNTNGAVGVTRDFRPQVERITDGTDDMAGAQSQPITHTFAPPADERGDTPVPEPEPTPGPAPSPGSDAPPVTPPPGEDVAEELPESIFDTTDQEVQPTDQ
jgi:hypothetical protein